MNTESVRTLISELPGLLAELKPHCAAARHLVQYVRETIANQPVDRLARRAKFAAHVQACTENGMVALAWDSMDCDCSRSIGSALYPPSVFALEHRIDLEYQEVEGPTSVWICKPSEAPERESRDLAMEAYEDGHPHVVYY